jgi:chromosome segregation ATPase
MGIDGAEIKRQKEKAEQEKEKRRAEEEKKQKKEEKLESDRRAKEEKYKKKEYEKQKKEEKLESDLQERIKEFEEEQEDKKRLHNIRLDCSACKSIKTMQADQIPRFNELIRLIGFIITIPAIIGVIVSLLMASTGGFGIFIGVIGSGSSLVGGLIGWLLLSKKNVYKCSVCNFILDRA